MDAQGTFHFAHLQTEGAAYLTFYFCSSVPVRNTNLYLSVCFATPIFKRPSVSLLLYNCGFSFTPIMNPQHHYHHHHHAPMHHPMHSPMHGPACSFTPTPNQPQLRNTEQEYTKLLLHLKENRGETILYKLYKLHRVSAKQKK